MHPAVLGPARDHGILRRDPEDRGRETGCRTTERTAAVMLTSRIGGFILRAPMRITVTLPLVLLLTTVTARRPGGTSPCGRHPRAAAARQRLHARRSDRQHGGAGRAGHPSGASPGVLPGHLRRGGRRHPVRRTRRGAADRGTDGCRRGPSDSSSTPISMTIASAGTRPSPGRSRAPATVDPTLIVSHENVLLKLAEEGRVPQEGLPTDTYLDTKEIWLNGEAIQLFHQPNAHTDGDTIVYFRKSDVISAGDLLPHDQLPGPRRRARRERPGHHRGPQQDSRYRDSREQRRGRHAGRPRPGAALR